MTESIRARVSNLHLGLAALAVIGIASGVLMLGSSGAGAARGQSCNGQPADVVVESGDTYIGGPADQVIVGSGGNEKIHARAGEDLICARGANDLIGAGAGDDDLYGGDGSDLLRARRGVDFLNGDDDFTPQQARGKEFDECHGHLPTPDPNPGQYDSARNCEFLRNAYDLDD